MKAITALCCTAALACGMTACNGSSGSDTNAVTAPDTHQADVKAISDNEAQWVKDWQSKDAAKVASYYADDAVVMNPGSPAMTGKAAIQSGLQEFMKDPAISLTFEHARVDVAKSGDLGYTQGTYTMTMTDPKTHKPITDHGTYVTTYRKQADGSWKAVADIATSSGSAAPKSDKKMM